MDWKRMISEKDRNREKVGDRDRVQCQEKKKIMVIDPLNQSNSIYLKLMS